MRKHLRRFGAIAAGIVVASLLASCSSEAGSSGSTSSSQPTRTIAVMMPSSENSYSVALLNGAKDEAKKLGNVKIVGFDGQFSAQTQQNQIQTIFSSGQYAGVVIGPNDGVSIASQFPSKIPVVTTLNPIGPKYEDMQPQVKGVLTTIARAPASAAEEQAKYVVSYCKSKNLNPCNVVLMVGGLTFPLDVVRQKAFLKILGADPDIKVVKTLEGNYDRGQGQTAMQNFLQSTKDVNALISTGDQMTYGVELALKQDGIDPSSVYLDSAGGTKYAISALRKGTWSVVYANYPGDWGAEGVKLIVDHAEGKKVPDYIDMDSVGPVPAFLTKETIKKYPKFTGEWEG